MNSLRSSVQEVIGEFSRQLDHQYPLDELFSFQGGDAKADLDFLFCINFVFIDFLKIRRDVHPFYMECFESVSKIEFFQKIKFNASRPFVNSSIRQMAHEYLFLGLRLAYPSVLSLNPSVSSSRCGHFLQIDFPNDIWTTLMVKMDRIDSITDRQEFIKTVRELYRILSFVGKSLGG